MTGTRPARAESIEPDALEAVVRESLVVLGIASLTGLALLVPGAGRELPGTVITVADVILAGGTAAVVGSLLYAVPRVRDLVAAAIEGPPAVVADVSAVAGYLVAFAAMLVAHRGLAPAALPLVDVVWAYDQAFFLLAAVVLVLMARRLYRSLDPIAGLVTREFFVSSGFEPSGTDTSE